MEALEKRKHIQLPLINQEMYLLPDLPTGIMVLQLQVLSGVHIVMRRKLSSPNSVLQEKCSGQHTLVDMAMIKEKV